MDENTYLLIGNIVLSILTLGFQTWAQLAPRLRSSTCCCGRDTMEFGTPRKQQEQAPAEERESEPEPEPERAVSPVRIHRGRRTLRRSTEEDA